MICIPIIAPTAEGIGTAMRAAARAADLVELRLDYAPGVDVAAVLSDRPCPVIVTCRPKREGGAFDGPEEKRIAVLQRAIDLGAEYVDIELDSFSRIRRNGRTRLIVSHHDFEKTPEDIQHVHAEMIRAGADVAKVVGMARDIRDNLRMFDLLQRTKHPTIAVCMGELGLISRILCRKFSACFLTFASLALGKESAPGQISAGDLAGLYRYRKIGRDTAVYGVIANPVAHSMSPAILNAAFDAEGFDGVYVPFKVDGDVVEFVNAFRALEVQGYSVTLPHKQAIIPAMDDLDEIVQQVGALNTVANRDGRLFGTNTDVPAALLALEAALASGAGGGARENVLAGRRVLLLGAGGAARALAFGLTTRGAKVVVANRTHEKAIALAEEIQGECCPMEDVSTCEADVLVNTTSVGMHPRVDESPVPARALRGRTVVFDAVYNPPETRLLREAKAAGCRAVSGIEWFVNQAAMQFELWTNLPAPREAMERVLRERLSGR